MKEKCQGRECVLSAREQVVREREEGRAGGVKRGGRETENTF